MTPLRLELAFRVRLDFGPGPRLRFGPVHGGFTRGYVGVLGGEVTGPRLTGRAVPHSGGDWPRFWPDGLVEFEAHYLLEASDGTPIYVHNRGFAWSSPEVLARMERGEEVDAAAYYARLTPTFEAPPGPHEWLSRSVFVGQGERHANHSVFEYYLAC